MWSDHLINVVKATVSLVPWVGWALSSLIADYVPTQKEKRLRSALEDIWEKLSLLDDSYNKIINTEWFAFLFERWLEWIKNHYQEMKIRCFKGIIINWLLKSNVAQQEKEYYLSLVEWLSDLHLRLLFLLYKHQQYFENYGIDTQDRRFESWNWDQVMSWSFPWFDLDVVYSVWSDLYKMSILRHECNRNVMMATSWLALIRQNHISALWSKFISFCIEY